MDHSQCHDRETMFDGRPAVEHVCPPCPHGLERGGIYTLHGNPELDDEQRQMKLRAIDYATCESKGHAEAFDSAPMWLLAEATRLLKRQPVDKDGCCIHCERVPQEQGHANDCPWLSHRRILNAIEAMSQLSEIVVWAPSSYWDR